MSGAFSAVTPPGALQLPQVDDAGLGDHPAVPGKHEFLQPEILAHLIHRGLERDRISGIALEKVNTRPGGPRDR